MHVGRAYRNAECINDSSIMLLRDVIQYMQRGSCGAMLQLIERGLVRTTQPRLTQGLTGVERYSVD